MLPVYNVRVPEIVVRWKLDNGVVVVLEVPLPVDDALGRELLTEIVNVLDDALRPFSAGVSAEGGAS